MFNFDLPALIEAVGYAGLFGIVFAESGLLIGFFLPGDSLLFTAGFLASQGFLNIWVLIPLMFVAAVVGDSVGYSIGYRLGPRIFKRKDSLIFHKDNLNYANRFFERHGGKTIILARFMPIVRTFAPILAGVGRMRYRTFLFYNLIGALAWAVGVTILGYFLGRVVPNVDRYLIPIIVIILLTSIAPSVIHIARDKHARGRIASYARKFFNRTK